MRSIPTVLIRPLEEKDIPLVKKWRKLPAWPKEAHSILYGSRTGIRFSTSKDLQDIILIAEPPDEEPIGLAHLSVYGMPEGIAQYSLAIPEPGERSLRSWDLFMFSVGAAFFVYKFKEIVSLIGSENGRLISMSLRSGFSEIKYFSFSDYRVPADLEVRVLNATPAKWTPIWGKRLSQKARYVPWLNANLDWVALKESCKNIAKPPRPKATICIDSPKAKPRAQAQMLNTVRHVIPTSKIMA